MMEKETSSNPVPHSHHNPSLLVLPKEESPGRRSPALIPGLVGNSGGGDRVKRDEWSEGAVSTLLESYEAKWVLRNRAKLKGQDWEDVARFVSSRANCTKSPKTQTQCKNKIESMKKRYRSESAAPDPSSWPLYHRLDMLLRGTPAMVPSTQQPPPPVPHPIAVTQTPVIAYNTPLVLLDPPLPLPPPPLPPAPPPSVAQNSHGSNGFDRVAAKEDGVGVGIKLLSSQVSDKNSIDTDSSTPALYSHENHNLKSKKVKSKKKMGVASGGRKKEGRSHDREMAESMRWLAEAIVRSEQARMETMKEVERMRIEAEAKRGEMDLKRTEIIANTQLEIARILASGEAGKCIDSSLRIGRH